VVAHHGIGERTTAGLGMHCRQSSLTFERVQVALLREATHRENSARPDPGRGDGPPLV